MKRTFIYTDEKSNKFWTIETNNNEFTVTYGKTGTAGQSSSKSFDSEEKCNTETEKIIAEKTKKGYVEENKVLSAKLPKSADVNEYDQQFGGIMEKFKKLKKLDKKFKVAYSDIHEYKIDEPVAEEEIKEYEKQNIFLPDDYKYFVMNISQSAPGPLGWIFEPFNTPISGIFQIEFGQMFPLDKDASIINQIKNQGTISLCSAGAKDDIQFLLVVNGKAKGSIWRYTPYFDPKGLCPLESRINSGTGMMFAEWYEIWLDSALESLGDVDYKYDDYIPKNLKPYTMSKEYANEVAEKVEKKNAKRKKEKDELNEMMKQVLSDLSEPKKKKPITKIPKPQKTHVEPWPQGTKINICSSEEMVSYIDDGNYFGDSVGNHQGGGEFFAFVIDGDVHIKGDIVLDEIYREDYVMVIIKGNLTVDGTLSYASGETESPFIVLGDLKAKNCVFAESTLLVSGNIDISNMFLTLYDQSVIVMGDVKAGAFYGRDTYLEIKGDEHGADDIKKLNSVWAKQFKKEFIEDVECDLIYADKVIEAIFKGNEILK